MNTGKTIQIFLPDGNPRSIRIADITSRTIQAILIPRQKLDDALIRKELESVGIYFLIGETESDAAPLTYVGEAECVADRIKQQNKDKEFWTFAIVIVSKTQYFTKTHVKFLEWYCHACIQKSGRFKLENATIPTKPHISEAIEADLMDNFDTIKTLVATLGYPLFDEIVKKDKKEICICKGKEAHAEGEYTEDGFVVFKGSTCNFVEAKASSQWISNLRKQLVDRKILQQKDTVYEFTTDYIFPSPSAAAVTVLARNANGWTEWKYANGKTLDEVHRQKG